MSEPRQNLRRLTLTGMGWTGGSRVVQLALQFVFAVVLARLLAPRDFGLIAALAVFTGFGIIFTDLGISPAIVQRPRRRGTPSQLGLLAELAMGAAPDADHDGPGASARRFLQRATSVALTLVSAPHFLLSTLAAVQNAILDRQMDFRKLSLIETTALITANACDRDGPDRFRRLEPVALCSRPAGPAASLLWFSVSWRPRLGPNGRTARALGVRKGFTDSAR